MGYTKEVQYLGTEEDEQTELLDEEEDEEETKEEDKEEPKPTDMVQAANAAAKRIEDANIAFSKNLDRQESLKVEDTLGGRADAGTPTQTEEEKEIAGAKELLKGTGFEEMLDPKKEE